MNERKYAMKKRINGSNLVILDPPRRDISPTLILAFATIISALIVSKRI